MAASALLLAGALLAGCASAPPASTLLALPSLGADGGSPSEAAAPPAAARSVLVVRRLGLPEYLLARRVRFRAGETTVDDWPGTFWAERIEVGMTRELTAALRERMPGWTLCNAACDGAGEEGGGVAPRMRSLRLEFAPLDYRRDRRELVAVLRGSLETPGGVLLQRLEQRYTLQATADTPQAHAALLGELLRRVAADVAPVAAALPAAPAPQAAANGGR